MLFHVVHLQQRTVKSTSLKHSIAEVQSIYHSVREIQFELLRHLVAKD